MRIFTDRIESQKNFWASYDELISAGSTIITFYGAGGLGKTRLAEKLMDEFAAQKIDNVKYLFHDFINGTDMRSILRRWKNELGKCGCEFPLFETGDFYLFVKQDKKILREKILETTKGYPIFLVKLLKKKSRLNELKVWTDEVVRAEKFNPHTYRKLKELSFIQHAEENFFTLDLTLQKIL